jgi:excisionase family DNA binding protein
MNEPMGWLTVPDVASQLGVEPGKVRQMFRDHQLLAVREGGVLRVPADLLDDGHVVKGLSGVLTLLSDAGYADEEMLRWLFSDDDTLPGRPVDALRQNRGTEVKRRAQTMGF